MFKAIIIALILVASVTAQSSGGGGGGGGPGPINPAEACSLIGYDLTLSKWTLVETRYLDYQPEFYTDNYNHLVILQDQGIARIISHDEGTAYFAIYEDKHQFGTLQKSSGINIEAAPTIVICTDAQEIPEFSLISGVIIGLLGISIILKRN